MNIALETKQIIVTYAKLLDQRHNFISLKCIQYIHFTQHEVSAVLKDWLGKNFGLPTVS